MNPSSSGLRRRSFLLQSILLAGTAPALLRAQNVGSKLDVVVIGCGGRGGGNLAEVAAAGENIIALCDVNGQNLAAATKKHPKARTFADFRKMYDTVGNFDAVVVSTAEHTHALAVMPALKRKKHVYCEKPLAHNIWEVRQLRQAAREAGVATQMGTQIHAEANFRRVVELVQAGAVGPIREVHVWVGRAWGRQSPEAAKRNHDIVTVLERPTVAQKPPAYLDWDLWLGPAPERPFNEVYFPGPKWYRWWDFGSGTMSDLGSHWNDLPFWALQLDAPKSVIARGPESHPELAPASMSATYEYAARGDRPALQLTWYQGEEKPGPWTRKEIPQWDSGVLFVGSRGMILSDYFKHTLLPEADFKGYTRPKPTIPNSLGHHREWLLACRNGGPTTCNFDYSGGLTEANHLGNVAYRLGKRIEWDPVKLECPNAPEAAPLIRRVPRRGWELPV